MPTPAKDPILEAATVLETVRAQYEAVVNTPMPDSVEDRIQWQTDRARLGIDVSKADIEFSRVVDAERMKALS
jgi:hypothetical protein